MSNWKSPAPDGTAPPRPPSMRWPYRAWSAYSRSDWAAEGKGAVKLTSIPKPDRLRGREYDEVDQ